MCASCMIRARRHSEQYRFRGVLGSFAFVPSQHDERVRRGLDPWLGIDGESAGRFFFGDQDAIQTDVEYTDAVRQAAHLPLTLAPAG